MLNEPHDKIKKPLSAEPVKQMNVNPSPETRGFLVRNLFFWWECLWWLFAGGFIWWRLNSPSRYRIFTSESKNLIIYEVWHEFGFYTGIEGLPADPAASAVHSGMIGRPIYLFTEYWHVGSLESEECPFSYSDSVKRDWWVQTHRCLASLFRF